LEDSRPDDDTMEYGFSRSQNLTVLEVVRLIHPALERDDSIIGFDIKYMTISSMYAGRVV
jgi:hypothetical protein